MFFAHFLVVFSLAPLVALAGHSQRSSAHITKRHRRVYQRDQSRNASSRCTRRDNGYTMSLVDKFAGPDFFDNWDFFTDADPTHGNVEYVGRDEATSSGLASVGSDNVTTLAVDDTNSVPVGGNRKSVRITSKKTYNQGLFVLDVNAMPTGCATWPAFWTVAGANWPLNGEIDIVEGVNEDSVNQMTLHTAPGCTLDTSAPADNGNSKAFLGNVLSTVCDALATGNSGCGVKDSNPDSFGAGIRDGGGAVFAMLWDEIGIRVWHFKRSEVPSDLAAFAPNPSAWPIPSAFWSTVTCPVNQFFKDHQIVINTSLCGDFAGSAYPSSGCPGTCAEHVADPTNFEDAKWKINYVATYQ